MKAIHRAAFSASLLASAISVFAAEPAIEAPAAKPADRVIPFRAVAAQGDQPVPARLAAPAGRPVQGQRVVWIENPAGAAAPGAAIKDDVIFIAGEVEMKKVAYLGVSTSTVPEAMAAQLKLPEGFGLVVDHVEPKGPAEAAGLRKHDLLVKVGDQQLINPAQLGTLVRSHKAGAEIELTVIRQGKETKLKATLVEKEVPVAPPLHAGAEVIPFGPDGFAFSPAEVRPGARPPRAFELELLKPRGVQKYADGEHQLEITGDGDGRKLVVKDKEGKVLFDGPINDDQQRKAVPDAVKPKLEKLEKSSRMQFKRAELNQVPGAQGALELELHLDDAGVEKFFEQHLKQLEGLPNIDQKELRKSVDEMKKQVQEMRQQIEKHRAELGALQIPGIPAIPGVPGAPGAPGAAPGGKFEHRAATSSAMASMSDGTHSITLKTDDKGKHLTVKDAEGKVLFEGPINTDKEREGIPLEARPKVEKLENSTRVNLNLEFRNDRRQPQRDEAKENRHRDDREDEKPRGGAAI